MVSVSKSEIRQFAGTLTRHLDALVGEFVDFGPELIAQMRSLVVDFRHGVRNREGYYCLLDDYTSIQVHENQKNPVLLLHGWFQNAVPLRSMVATLRDRGMLVYRVHHNPWIDRHENLEHLRGVVQNILDRTGCDRVDLVGHSLGGLDARLLARDTGWVEDCVTLGTPNLGIRIAEIHPLVWMLGVTSRSVRQMRIGSNLLELLNGTDGYHSDTNYVSIYSPTDLLVPGDRARISRGINVDLDEMLGIHGIGHGRMIVAPEVMALTRAVLNSKYREVVANRWETAFPASWQAQSNR